MAPKQKRTSANQKQLETYPLLKKPLEMIGKKIEFPGSFWQGSMTAVEKSKKYIQSGKAAKVHPIGSKPTASSARYIQSDRNRQRAARGHPIGSKPTASSAREHPSRKRNPQGRNHVITKSSHICDY